MKYQLQNPILSCGLLLAIGLVNTPLAQAQDQTVTPDVSSISADVGGKCVFTLLYNAGDKNLTGLGLRMHFDSTKISWVSNESVLSTGLLSADPAPQPDTEDFDQNPSTDSYVGIAWMSLNSRWPGDTTLPLALYQAHFVSAMAPGQQTQVNFTASSTSAGYSLSSIPVRISSNVGN